MEIKNHGMAYIRLSPEGRIMAVYSDGEELDITGHLALKHDDE